MNVENQEIKLNHRSSALIPNTWIENRLQQTIEKVHVAFKEYRFDLLAQTLYEFTWYDYCDWYLELAKCILNDDTISSAEKAHTRHTLISVLEKLLRLIHPVMPFITEEIWQIVSPLLNLHESSIMIQAYPIFEKEKLNASAEKEIEWLKQVITAIRNIRSEVNISPAKKITVLFNKGDEQDQIYIARYQTYIQSLARVEKIILHEMKNKLPLSSASLVGQLEIHVPLEGLIDIQTEISRLQKEIQKLEKEIQKSKQKLDNQHYINKAPADVIENEKKHFEEISYQLTQLEIQKQKLQS